MCLKFRISYSLTYLRIVACCFVCFGTFIVCCTLFPNLPSFSLCASILIFLFTVWCAAVAVVGIFLVVSCLHILHCRWPLMYVNPLEIHFAIMPTELSSAQILLYSFSLASCSFLFCSFFGCALLMINILIWNSYESIWKCMPFSLANVFLFRLSFRHNKLIEWYHVGKWNDLTSFFFIIIHSVCIFSHLNRLLCFCTTRSLCWRRSHISMMKNRQKGEVS